MLLRKNVMIKKEYWEDLEALYNIRKSRDKKASISKITNEALKMYSEKEKENNLAYKLQGIAKNMSKEEEKEITEELSNMTAEDLKITKVTGI